MTKRLVHSSKQLAYYYPAWSWEQWSLSESSVKNLILFFDGIAMLAPSRHKDAPYRTDPALVLEMERLGLITILEAEKILDHAASQSLAENLLEYILTGVFDDLPKRIEEARLQLSRRKSDVSGDGERIEPFDRLARLSMAQLGFADDAGIAQMIYDEFRKRNLVGKVDRTGAFLADPAAAIVVRLTLAPLVVSLAERQGLNLSPVTDQPIIHAALVDLLQLPSMPSAATVALVDVSTVGVDLTGIPFEEVLEFKSKNENELQHYKRSMVRFLIDLEALPTSERQSGLIERQAEIQEAAERVRRSAEQAWKRPAVFGFGLAGAVWALGSGDVFGGLLQAGAALLGADFRTEKHAGAFSYLITGAQRFGR